MPCPKGALVSRVNTAEGVLPWRVWDELDAGDCVAPGRESDVADGVPGASRIGVRVQVSPLGAESGEVLAE